MRFVVRADASRAIGAGHAMRVAVIAEELIAIGKEVHFIGTAEEISWVQKRLNGLNFAGVMRDQSLFQSNPYTDVLILDSYTISRTDSFLEKERWKKIILIADQETPDYSCDLAINPGLIQSWQSKNSVKTLFGPRFIPFRKSSSRVKGDSVIHIPIRILVVGGGTDIFEFSRAISGQLTSIKTDFICYLVSEDAASGNFDPRFRVVPPGEQLDHLVEESDLIITTASTSSLEFIAKSKPIGILCAVDNQNSYYEQLTAAGMATPLGRYQNHRWNVDFLKISELVFSKELRENLIKKGLNVIDLGGASRIALEILDVAR